MPRGASEIYGRPVASSWPKYRVELYVAHPAVVAGGLIEEQISEVVSVSYCGETLQSPTAI